MATVAAAEGFPVAILNYDEPTFCCVPAKAYEALMDKLEDMELNSLADALAEWRKPDAAVSEQFKKKLAERWRNFGPHPQEAGR